MKYIRTDKLYGHPDRLQAYKNGKTVYPVTVEIHLTNRCNIKCSYCCFADRQDNTEMSFKDAIAVVEKLSDMHVKAVAFSGGGEPTMHPNLAAVIAHARRAGMDVGLITNGVKFDSYLLNNLKWVRFSLDAGNATLYKKIKGVDKYNDVIRNIKNAVEYKEDCNLPVTIGIHTVVTEDNVDRLYEIATLADFLGVDYFQYRPLERGNTLEKPEIPRDLRIPIMDTSYKWEELKEATPYTCCPGADFIGVVGVDLNFYICSVHTYDKTASYGNVLTSFLDNRHLVQREFDYSKCPIACRGAVINRCLAEYDKIEHVNFL